MRIEIKFNRKNLYCINSWKNSINFTCYSTRMVSQGMEKRETILRHLQTNSLLEISSSHQAWEKRINRLSQMVEICLTSRSLKVILIRNRISSNPSSTIKTKLRSQRNYPTELELQTLHGGNWEKWQWVRIFSSRTGMRDSQMRIRN